MTNEQERLEQEEFDQELAKLEAKFGPENVSIMGKHGIKELTLIWEEKEYEPSEDRGWTVLKEKEYLEALRGIHAWVCVKGHCHWEGDYILIESGIIAECPVKMMLDSVEFYNYLGCDTIPDDDGRCPYYKEGGKQ